MTAALTQTFLPPEAGPVSTPAATLPDAALLAACAEYTRLDQEERRLGNLHGDAGEGPDAQAADTAYADACAASQEAIEALIGMVPQTIEGAIAKACAALTYRRSYEPRDKAEHGYDFNERAILSPLCDLERLTQGPAVPKNDDWVAKLLAGDPQITAVWEIITTKAPDQVEAWLRYGEFLVRGEDKAVAKARFDAEIAGTKAPSEPVKKRRGPRGAKTSPVRELSFVADHRPNGEPLRHFWTPPIRTDLSQAVHGFQMADEFRAWRRRHPGGGPLLPSIVADMPRNLGACEIAFLSAMEGYRHSGASQ